MLPPVQGADDLWLLSRERMYDKPPLSGDQQFWRTVACFLVVGVTVIIVAAIVMVTIVAVHGPWHG